MCFAISSFRVLPFFCHSGIRTVPGYQTDARGSWGEISRLLAATVNDSCAHETTAALGTQHVKIRVKLIIMLLV